MLEDYPSRADRDQAMADWLESRGVTLVVCAGYMHLLTPGFLARFQAINVHPSLLPSFPGTRAVEDALTAGVAETGVTVHLLDEGIDTGPVLAQEPVPVLPGDTVETLRARIQAVEHRLLPELLASGWPAV
jgi:phosphoribosylglycinamide formyltransferase-1